MVGNLIEILFNVKLWDYSDMFLPITQYTSLTATILYGTIAYCFFKFIFNPLLKFFNKHVSYKCAKRICLTLGLLLILDQLRLNITMLITNEAPQFWKIIIFQK